MLFNTYSSAVQGIDARTITVEVNAGIPNPNLEKLYFMVGLPDNAVREGSFRIESALNASGFKRISAKTVVNLAPADIRKEGSAFDLPIAVGMLGAYKQFVAPDVDTYIIMGELAMDGQLRPITGALPIALQAKKEGFKGLILPKINAPEAAIVEGLNVYGLQSLRETILFLEGQIIVEPEICAWESLFARPGTICDEDFSDVKGQENIKRALELAAAGGHNAIMIGPPGAGKTMLARRMPGILPPLSIEEALETTKIHSVAGMLSPNSSLLTARPFRAPHHTVSDVALVGGGSIPRPGEISLAHNGVLFLDELPEFKRSVLEVLRQPIEERKVTISRARSTVDFPASFMLIASMNPCPCGFHNHPDKMCVCGPGVVKRYVSRISGPLLDRFDLHVEVVPVTYDELTERKNKGECSANISQRVIQARLIQSNRFKDHPGLYANAHMPGNLVREVCKLDDAGLAILKLSMERLQLSARAYDRILKVARTAADLSGSENIQIEHLAEAIHFRSLDRANWCDSK